MAKSATPKKANKPHKYCSKFVGEIIDQVKNQRLLAVKKNAKTVTFNFQTYNTLYTSINFALIHILD